MATVMIAAILYWLLSDPDPILLDTVMNIADAQWNSNGSILAVAGQLKAEMDSNLVSFYSPRGEVCSTIAFQLVYLNWSDMCIYY